MGCAGSTPAEPIDEEQARCRWVPQEQAGGSRPLLELEDESTPLKVKPKLKKTFKDLHEGKPGSFPRRSTVLQTFLLRKSATFKLQFFAFWTGLWSGFRRS